jgi:hypothetical protein
MRKAHDNQAGAKPASGSIALPAELEIDPRAQEPQRLEATDSRPGCLGYRRIAKDIAGVDDDDPAEHQDYDSQLVAAKDPDRVILSRYIDNNSAMRRKCRVGLAIGHTSVA